MLYVSSIENERCGVTDTDDGVVEYYSKKDLLSICANGGIEVRGVKNGNVMETSPLLENMHELKPGQAFSIKGMNFLLIENKDLAWYVYDLQTGFDIMLTRRKLLDYGGVAIQPVNEFKLSMFKKRLMKSNPEQYAKLFN